MRLLEQVRGVLRAKHYAYRTEQCYVQWILRYIRFHGIKHPNTLGTSEIEQFLTHLATHDKVAASTQNQAPSTNGMHGSHHPSTNGIGGDPRAVTKRLSRQFEPGDATPRNRCAHPGA